ncbi:MaoC/PaaZ C-terminal domain-containing protein [Actinomyces trachealis]|uniref:MaoC/PaaZ C-terminal domain-containing protein n=1 Tax=Actinomyces trachealis TaxID=2763540 RepID=UPI0018C6F54E|nr:MaoC/PaaZ C-terminal domain-containing protein [Actinomyces trachealis]
MSNQDPVDPRSAGSSGTGTPSRAGEGARLERVRGRDSGDDAVATAQAMPQTRTQARTQELAQAMAQVVRGLLDRSGVVVTSGQIEAAMWVLIPVVMSLRRVRAWLPTGAWDELVHRRCRLRPADVAATGSLTDSTGVTVELLAQRGGWELLRAKTGHAAPGSLPVFVEHELARLVQDLPRHIAKPNGSSSEPGAASPGTCCPAGATTTTASTPASSTRVLCVTADDVAAWARATGDHNAIHLEPGRGQDCGLLVGDRQVVAHGTLLAALSLALAPPHSPALDLRFVHPLAVGASGVPVHLKSAGDVASGDQVLLKRRQL